MTKQDGYEIGLKLLGIYFLILACAQLPVLIVQFMSLWEIVSMITSDVPRQLSRHLFQPLLGLLTPFMYFLASFFLIKKTEIIVRKLIHCLKKANALDAPSSR